MVKIDWIRLIRENQWFGWIYYGAERDGNPFARDNRIYWQYYNYDITDRFMSRRFVLRRYLKMIDDIDNE
jgi:hypothetical protein